MKAKLQKLKAKLKFRLPLTVGHFASKLKLIKPKKIPVRNILKQSLYVLGILIVLVFIFITYFIQEFDQDLPDPNTLSTRKVSGSTIIYDRNGTELYRFYNNQNREFVKLADYPSNLKWAVLSAEDINYYQHQGVDYLAMLRCLAVDIKNIVQNSDFACGGSTISQQLVRNTIMYDAFGNAAFERSDLVGTIKRKIQEIILTFAVERKYSKDEILQMYLNEVPLGGVNYGFQSASRAYFGKNVQDLTLAEDAVLAGLIQSPTTYNPLFGNHPEMAKTRQTYVLDQMYSHKDLTSVTTDNIVAAKAQPLTYTSERNFLTAPHFVFYVKQQLQDLYGNDFATKGLKVTTTLDLPTQKIAESTLQNGIAKYGPKYNANNGALVALDPKTDQILSMVGSVDYYKSTPQVNGNFNVTMSKRQMGSSVKPYTYLTAITKGYGMWLETPDIDEFNYNVQNYDRLAQGFMTARQALVQSHNVSAVYTLDIVGPQALADTLQKLGIDINPVDPNDLSITLGTKGMTLLEHTSAFSIFPAEGKRAPLTSILKIEDSQGNTLVDNTALPAVQVFTPEQIYPINWALCDLGGFNDYNYANPPYNYHSVNGKKVLCGKTGTSDGPNDLVSMMYHKNIIVGVWAGNNDNSPMPNGWSYTVSMPITHDFMEQVAAKYPPQLFDKPDGIINGVVCKDTGAIPSFDNKLVPCVTEKTVYSKDAAPTKDKRDITVLCKTNNLIPTNINLTIAARMSTTKTILNYTLPLASQQKHFDNFLKTPIANGTLNDVGSAECPVPKYAYLDNNFQLATSDLTVTSSLTDKIFANKQFFITGTISNYQRYKKLIVRVGGFEPYNGPVTKGSFNIPYTLLLPSNYPISNLGSYRIQVNLTDVNDLEYFRSYDVKAYLQ